MRLSVCWRTVPFSERSVLTPSVRPGGGVDLNAFVQLAVESFRRRRRAEANPNNNVPRSGKNHGETSSTDWFPPSSDVVPRHSPPLLPLTGFLSPVALRSIRPMLPPTAACSLPSLDHTVTRRRRRHGGTAADPPSPAAAPQWQFLSIGRLLAATGALCELGRSVAALPHRSPTSDSRRRPTTDRLPSVVAASVCAHSLSLEYVWSRSGSLTWITRFRGLPFVDSRSGENLFEVVDDDVALHRALASHGGSARAWVHQRFFAPVLRAHRQLAADLRSLHVLAFDTVMKSGVAVSSSHRVRDETTAPADRSRRLTTSKPTSSRSGMLGRGGPETAHLRSSAAVPLSLRDVVSSVPLATEADGLYPWHGLQFVHAACRSEAITTVSPDDDVVVVAEDNDDPASVIVSSAGQRALQELLFSMACTWAGVASLRALGYAEADAVLAVEVLRERIAAAFPLPSFAMDSHERVARHISLQDWRLCVVARRVSQMDAQVPFPPRDKAVVGAVLQLAKSLQADQYRRRHFIPRIKRQTSATSGERVMTLPCVITAARTMLTDRDLLSDTALCGAYQNVVTKSKASRVMPRRRYEKMRKRVIAMEEQDRFAAMMEARLQRAK